MEIPTIRWKMVRESTPEDRERLRGPEDVARLASYFTDGEPAEVFGVFYLNSQHQPNAVEIITRGTLDASLVHPREVFRGAILNNAAGLVLFHNHPSGDPTPSREDREVTKQLSKAGDVVGIPLVDHVITGDRGRFTSLAQEGPLV